jgi:hypothetical protein
LDTPVQSGTLYAAENPVERTAGGNNEKNGNEEKKKRGGRISFRKTERGAMHWY